ncbi:IclR family transcriptional regulator C-terminal domain-containing protein [Streptomyces sp. NPDC006654]|uniref:IclR family transcriptional regulator n=1 Tax=Streptomyces sp. NPDC006654 TaxID=3156897 RepID=UPI0033C93929
MLLREQLLPHLADLYELTHKTVHLAVLRGTDIVYVNKIQGHRATRSPSRIGARLPTAPASARPCSPSTPTRPRLPSAGLPARTQYTLADPRRFREELRRIRQDGIAYDRQEAAPGLTCVAVPIMSASERPVAALSVAGAHHRFEPSRYAPALRRVAFEAARALTAAKGRQAAAPYDVSRPSAA